MAWCQELAGGRAWPVVALVLLCACQRGPKPPEGHPSEPTGAGAGGADRAQPLVSLSDAMTELLDDDNYVDCRFGPANAEQPLEIAAQVACFNAGMRACQPVFLRYQGWPLRPALEPALHRFAYVVQPAASGCSVSMFQEGRSTAYDDDCRLLVRQCSTVELQVSDNQIQYLNGTRCGGDVVLSPACVGE